MKKFSIYIILLLFLCVGNAFGATYYIDQSAADDSANGTSTGTPWKRCPGMVGFAGSYSHSAGDVFKFKGGETWTATELPLTVGYSGTSGNIDTYTVDATWYTGGSWTRPEFNLGDTDVKGVIVNSKDYITINNIKMTNIADCSVGESYIVIDGSAYVTVQNCYLEGSSGSGDANVIYLRDFDNVTIDNNFLQSALNDGNPDVILCRPWWRMSNLTISNNEITSSGGGDGIHIDVEHQAAGYNATYPYGNMTHYGPITIEDNNFHTIPGVKMGIILIAGAKDLTIQRNQFHGNIETGIAIRMGGSTGQEYYSAPGVTEDYWYENVKIINNIFWRITALDNIFSGWGGIINIKDTGFAEDGGDDPVSTNNIVANNSIFDTSGTYEEYQIGINQDGVSPHGNSWTIKNNLIQGMTTGIDVDNDAGVTLTHNLFYDNSTNGDLGTSSQTGNPLMTDPSNGDLSIASGSGAIDNGADLSAYFTADYISTSRTENLPFDIGAYEYVSEGEASGTIIPGGCQESEIVAGGKTIVIELVGTDFVAAGATFDGQRQNIINGMDSAQAEAAGWDAVVKAELPVTAVVRTDANTVTITLSDFDGDPYTAYQITANETVTVTIPATAVEGSVAIVCTPTFQISAEQIGAETISAVYDAAGPAVTYDATGPTVN